MYDRALMLVARARTLVLLMGCRQSSRSEPVADNDSAARRQRNRRVEAIICNPPAALGDDTRQEKAMRYDPATYVRAAPWTNTGAHARHQPVSTLRLADGEAAISRQSAELDDWEDEEGATVGHDPESPCWPVGRHFDEYTG